MAGDQLSLLAVFGAKSGQAARVRVCHQLWEYGKELRAGGWGDGFYGLWTGVQALAGGAIGKYHLMLIK